MSETTTPSSQSVVFLTEAAIQKMRETLAELPDALGIRLGVAGGGCAGLQYEMKPCTEKLDGDFIQQADEDVALYIHPVAAAYLKGTTLDFSTDLMDGGFKFKNPNASSSCGCGSSFGV